jgi:hypothetical protein
VAGWTKEAFDAIKLCKEWVKEEDAVLAPSDVYLFGSAIYESGAQFDSMHSDLDIVCVLPQAKYEKALDRYEFVKNLREPKGRLELKMIPALGRQVCDEPGVSVIPITTFELEFNVHKSGVRRFFTRNIFLNLRTDERFPILEPASDKQVEEELRHALEYVQGIRNKFLSVAANGYGGIPSHQGTDPLPKSLMRTAAQVDPNVEPGRWYDTRGGLEFWTAAGSVDTTLS